MKKGIVALVALIACFGQAVAAESKWPDRIKVLLAEDAQKAVLEVKGKYEVVDPRTGSHLSSGSAKCYPIEAHSGGLQWGEGYPDIFQIAVLPLHAETTILVNGVEYRGALLVYEVSGRLYVVNDLPIEEYTQCMLAVKAPTELEDEAVSALAIVMRSDAYSKVLRSRSAYWHVRARDVGYCGDGAGVWSDRYRRAVEQTSGMLLVASEVGGRPIPAQFTDHCAGRTIGYDMMQRASVASSLKGVDAPLAARARDETAWNCSVSKSELAQIAGLDTIEGMNLYADDFSGKVYAVRFYDGMAMCDLDFHTLQASLGSSRLQGSDFVVDTTGNQVTFNGHGAGAGVGLCLYSANALAERGHDAATILKTFFPHAQLHIASPEQKRASGPRVVTVPGQRRTI